MVDLWQFAPDPAPYTDAGVPDWLDQLDLHPAEPHHRMSTHTLDHDDVFVYDGFRDTELALRNRLLDEQHDTVFALHLPGEAGAHEAAQLVAASLSRRGLGPLRDDVNPFEAAGRAVQEDLCILTKRDRAWHLDAAVLCFPSLWSLREKFALPMAGIHAGVPHLADDLGTRIDRLFDKLSRAVWRRNLSIKPYPLLFLPLAKNETSPSGSPVDDTGAPYWLRSEYQTLQRLPHSGAILFTIKIQVAPLGVLIERRDIAQKLLAMYNSWSPNMHDYKTAGGNVAEHVIPWLARRS